ncbi:hypothetical protein ABT314_39290, partial [Streptomyces spiralis]
MTQLASGGQSGGTAEDRNHRYLTREMGADALWRLVTPTPDGTPSFPVVIVLWGSGAAEDRNRMAASPRVFEAGLPDLPSSFRLH